MLSDSTTSRQVLRAMEDAADVKKRRIVDDEVNVKEALSTSSAPAPTTGGAQQAFRRPPGSSTPATVYPAVGCFGIVASCPPFAIPS